MHLTRLMILRHTLLSKVGNNDRYLPCFSLHPASLHICRRVGRERLSNRVHTSKIVQKWAEQAGSQLSRLSELYLVLVPV